MKVARLSGRRLCALRVSRHAALSLSLRGSGSHTTCERALTSNTCCGLSHPGVPLGNGHYWAGAFIYAAITSCSSFCVDSNRSWRDDCSPPSWRSSQQVGFPTPTRKKERLAVPSVHIAPASQWRQEPRHRRLNRTHSEDGRRSGAGSGAGTAGGPQTS